MIFMLLLVMLISVIGLRLVSPFPSYFDDSLAPAATMPVKGMFTLLIFMSHFFPYIVSPGALDAPYAVFQKAMGQMVVVMFMFYSGLGIMTSIERKGDGYVRALPVRRILRILFNFDIIVLTYLAVQLALGQRYDGASVMTALVGWDSLGNSNWYIFDILWAYGLTWIAFAIFRRDRTKALALATVLTAAFVIVMARLKPLYWYDTFACYTAGLWYAAYRQPLEGFVKRKPATYWLTMAAVLAVLAVCFKLRGHAIFAIGQAVAFALTVVLITMKVRLGNPVLRWAGDHLFEIYMLQRLPMIIWGLVPAVANNEYLYFIMAAASTVGLAYIFKKLLTTFDGWLFA